MQGRCGILLVLLVLGGCDLFAPRTPEPPITESGTYLQPDTPDQVIENLEAAVAELNTLNYRRSFAEALTFHPTATAEARTAIWTGWGRAEEEQYFGTLAAAAQAAGTHSLRLSDGTLAVQDADRYVYDAGYVLTVQHRRTDAPTSVQGRLIWTLEQGEDGLWQITEWTDRELGTAPSWSDLKAAFLK